MCSLFYVVRRVEDQLDEPAPEDLVRTLGNATVLLGISKRTTDDQP